MSGATALDSTAVGEVELARFIVAGLFDRNFLISAMAKVGEQIIGPARVLPTTVATN
jgi:hypothetical protein